MFDALRTRVLRFLRVPPDPEPPAGAAGSVRVFRAGRKLYQLRLLRWVLGQAGALAGILFSLTMLERMERGVEAARRGPQPAPVGAQPATPSTRPPPVVTVEGESATPKAVPEKSKSKLSPEAKKRARSGLTRMAEKWPSWIFPVLALFEWIGVALYVAQIPLTYAMVRLDYELRWYIVTDRSLRIRSGLTTVQELTMSFANVQQVVVTQGPLQRLLGIADVRVQSAGGGGGGEYETKTADTLHTGVFHGVDNAHEIRDLVLERLRQFRETGLGDPDDVASLLPAAGVSDFQPQALAAAQELLNEARALRATLG